MHFENCADIDGFLKLGHIFFLILILICYFAIVMNLDTMLQTSPSLMCVHGSLYKYGI